MNRLVVALLLVFAWSAATVSPAAANTPCRNLIYNDWYQDGKIASTYPVSCYRDALRHLGSGDQVYTSLEDDIRAALQAALARQHGKQVAHDVGRGFTKPVLVDSKRVPSSAKDEHPNSTEIDAPALAASTPADATSDGIPAPLLVLGGLALALLAAGGAGTIARRRRR